MASQDWFDKDFYKVLGVAKDVSEAELKKVYRKLSRQFHPDTNPGDAKAEARFKEISEAYSVLSDKEQRAEYDQMRAMGSGARFTGGQGGGFPGGFPGGANFGGGGFEDVFANLFGGGGRGGFGPQRGADLTTSTTLDFIDGVKGTTIKLQLKSNGEPTSIKIPAGVQDGQKIKIAGKGQASPNGGPAGDLIITVTVKPHPVFTRDGQNIRVTVPVTFAEAVLGATIQVPTLGGDPVKLKVAPGTPNGRVLRVKGRGVVTAKGEGDLLATVDIAVPSHINDKARKALEEFESHLPDEDPREDLLNKAGLL
ncbi:MULTISPECIES: DnaJ C-terminal domain-containing protein [Rhodoluna]|jgi:molecular chaperone DnaJ|uniref:DnaJ C-terminal domain-containing protein n=1 Tax=Rhodoluna TaxID=529883 RepID=UPI001105DEBE|nr:MULTISPECIES: DnaJ C-terminal domain-containing protein [Rhodoluna]BDS49689.1 molecular chaperone DnaJ [Rhodoluna sp. KAS3]